jgi:signal peptidase II
MAKLGCFLQRILVALALAAADLVSKYMMFAYLADRPGQSVKLFPFLNLVTVRNTGVSFGMFSGSEDGRFWLSAVGGAIVAVMLIWLWKAKSRAEATAICFVIGGAIGNIVDRLANGHVADFVDLYYKQYHWPAFNLADSVIFVGVAMLLWLEYAREK